MRKTALAILMTIFGVQLEAADICEAKASYSIRAIESSDSILKKGETIDAVTQYRIEDGVAQFCSHGGYCYPRYIYKNGRKVEALKLTNCKIVNGEVVVDRSKNSPKKLKYEDLTNKFLKMGACSYCADNIAQHVRKKPNGQCGVIAKRALKGDYQAISILQSMPEYCTWQY